MMADLSRDDFSMSKTINGIRYRITKSGYLYAGDKRLGYCGPFTAPKEVNENKMLADFVRQYISKNWAMV